MLISTLTDIALSLPLKLCYGERTAKKRDRRERLEGKKPNKRQRGKKGSYRRGRVRNII